MSQTKLRGRIYEKFGSQSNFATAMEMDSVAINRRLNGGIPWKLPEVERAVKLLDIPTSDVWVYFFAE